MHGASLATFLVKGTSYTLICIATLNGNHLSTTAGADVSVLFIITFRDTANQHQVKYIVLLDWLL